MSPRSPHHNPAMTRVVERNIQALLDRQRAERQRGGLQTRAADTITAFTGSMKFVYIHLVIFGAWIVINLGWTPLRPFDPTFVALAMAASVEAIFLSTFVLISQNRMQAEADRRADLDVQISLLTEHEVTKLLTLTDAIAQKLEIVAPAEIHDVKRDVAPEDVLDKLDEQQDRS